MSILTSLRVKRLIGKLGLYSSQGTREQAIADLVKIGSPAVDPLIQALDQKDYDTVSVIKALGQLGDARAVEPIFGKLVSVCISMFYRNGNEKRRDSVLVALKRIGEPARKYATEMSESEQLRKRFGESVDAFVRQAANLFLEWLEQDREDEQLANKLVTLIRQANSEYSIDKEAYEKTHTEIRKIGEDICSNGGHDRMVKIAYQVQALGESIRNLELHWQGICGWRF